VTFVLPTTGEFDARTRRMATSLAARGHAVRVIARLGGGLPERDGWAGGVEVIRVPAGADARPGGGRRPIAEASRMLGVARASFAQAEAASRLPGADPDVIHAMGFLALPAARRVQGRTRPPRRLVYDARDLYAEANNIARLPSPLRAAFRWRERSWARDADAILTVNDALASEIAERWGVTPAVILNASPRWDPPDPPPNLLRERLGLEHGTRVVLYHGGFMPDRGLPELVVAHRDPRLRAAHLVLMGDGVMAPRLRTLGAEPESAGRVHLLPSVPPEELLRWVASADACVMPNQPRTLNERLSTPNKLFEALAAGVPVVSSDFPARRRIIVGDPLGPLGAVCDPTDPAALAAAIAAVALLPQPELAALRARCLAAAHARYAWEAQLPILLAAYARVTGRPW
jgi:glycosyltransferase involved in cell wall biosynthesis